MCRYLRIIALPVPVYFEINTAFYNDITIQRTLPPPLTKEKKIWKNTCHGRFSSITHLCNCDKEMKPRWKTRDYWWTLQESVCVKTAASSNIYKFCKRMVSIFIDLSEILPVYDFLWEKQTEGVVLFQDLCFFLLHLYWSIFFHFSFVLAHTAKEKSRNSYRALTFINNHLKPQQENIIC